MTAVVRGEPAPMGRGRQLRLRRSTAGPEADGAFAPLETPAQLAPLLLAACPGRGACEGPGAEGAASAAEVVAGALAAHFGGWLPDASFLALEADGPVGAVLVALHDGGRPFVVFLYTRPDRVGTGVATRLVARACQALRASGHPSVELLVSPANHRALRLYRRLGFAAVSGAAPEPAPESRSAPAPAPGSRGS